MSSELRGAAHLLACRPPHRLLPTSPTASCLLSGAFRALERRDAAHLPACCPTTLLAAHLPAPFVLIVRCLLGFEVEAGGTFALSQSPPLFGAQLPYLLPTSCLLLVVRCLLYIKGCPPTCRAGSHAHYSSCLCARIRGRVSFEEAGRTIVVVACVCLGSLFAVSVVVSSVRPTTAGLPGRRKESLANFLGIIQCFQVPSPALSSSFKISNRVWMVGCGFGAVLRVARTNKTFSDLFRSFPNLSKPFSDPLETFSRAFHHVALLR
jgi:hypothetical protein